MGLDINAHDFPASDARRSHAKRRQRFAPTSRKDYSLMSGEK